MKNIFSKVRRGMNMILSGIAAVLLITMSCLVIYQVFTRYVLNNPSDFTEEVVRYSLIWTGFIGAAYGFSTRQHMALMILPNKLSPARKKFLMVLVDALVLVFAVAVLTIGGARLAFSARREFSALLGISRSLVYSMAPISGVFIVIAQIINIWEDVTGISLAEEDK